MYSLNLKKLECRILNQILKQSKYKVSHSFSTSKLNGQKRGNYESLTKNG